MKLLITGPIFNTPSGPSGMGGALYTQLTQSGYQVSKKSAFQHPVLRLIDSVYGALCFDYDILFIQGFALKAFILEWLLIRIARLRNKKIIYNLHGGAFPEFYQQNTRWCKQTLSKVDRIVTPSMYLSQFLLQEGFKPEVIPNFIDLRKFPYAPQKQEKTLNLLWVRAFHPIYRPMLMLETFHEVVTRHPEATLTMVGPDMGELELFKAKAISMGIMDRIRIAGYVPNNTLHAFYASHTVLVTTTQFESFGVALVEAAACGIPMVSTAVGEIPFRWKHLESCLLVNQAAPAALADAIMHLYTHPDLRSQITENALSASKQHTWEHVEPMWNQLFKSLLHVRN